MKHMSQQERHEAVNEIRLMASITHPNVVSYNEAFIDGNKLCIVMEFAPYGDLARAIRKGQAMRKPFPEDMIWSFFIQVCQSVHALHEARILHRDVKAANVLITAADTVKIGDLGIAKFMKTGMTKTQIGTPHYMPPEVWRNRPYSFSSDVWALGCLLYEMSTFQVPFEARSMSELRAKVLRGKVPPIPKLYSSEMQRMVSLMLDPNPETRPSLGAILSLDSVVKRKHLLPEHLQAVESESPGRGNPHLGAGALLETIQVPRNLRLLKDRLPGPQYPEENDSLPSWQNDATPERYTSGSVNQPEPRLSSHADAGSAGGAPGRALAPGAAAGGGKAPLYAQRSPARVAPPARMPASAAPSQVTVYSQASAYSRVNGPARGQAPGAYGRSPQYGAATPSHSRLPSIQDSRYGVKGVSRVPNGRRGVGSAMGGNAPGSIVSRQSQARPYDLISHRPRY